jgi:hypothetical protein
MRMEDGVVVVVMVVVAIYGNIMRIRYILDMC